jgi:hypothetical protein
VRRKAHAGGWGLAALAVAAIVPLGAFHAHGDAAFDRWAGWAGIATVPLTAGGLLLLLLDMPLPGDAPDPGSTPTRPAPLLPTRVRFSPIWHSGGQR